MKELKYKFGIDFSKALMESTCTDPEKTKDQLFDISKYMQLAQENMMKSVQMDLYRTLAGQEMLIPKVPLPPLPSDTRLSKKLLLLL